MVKIHTILVYLKKKKKKNPYWYIGISRINHQRPNDYKVIHLKHTYFQDLAETTLKTSLQITFTVLRAALST